VNDLVEWFFSHQVTGWLAFVSLLMFVGSLIVMPVLVARMRSDYFVSRQPSPDSWAGQHAGVRLFLLIVKNLAGLILLLAGIAMLVLPGQGVITILVSITLLNFPGKRWLELRIVRQRRVRQLIKWIRAKARRPPLIIPEREDDDD
jgi:hypothetical protein